MFLPNPTKTSVGTKSYFAHFLVDFWDKISLNFRKMSSEMCKKGLLVEVDGGFGRTAPLFLCRAGNSQNVFIIYDS